jgi:hypothetical protein
MRVASAVDVLRIQGHASAAMTDVLGMAVRVDPSGTDAAEWSRARVGTRVQFRMIPISERDWDWADRVRGGRTPVVVVKRWADIDRCVWAAWHEEWMVVKLQEFELIGAGWTFFWGAYLRPKAQILRAEWDEVEHRGGRAPQPHWHVDTELLATFVAPLATRPQALQAAEATNEGLEEVVSNNKGGGLEEIANLETIQPLVVAGMHLGMAGWQNSQVHPQCWQRPHRDDYRDLAGWCVNVLESARDQFELLRALPQI